MKLTIITISAVIGLCVGFQLGCWVTMQVNYQNAKAQIVKEALSKIPTGKINLGKPENAKEFKEMIQKFKGGE
jgi:hypothetical protein